MIVTILFLITLIIVMIAIIKSYPFRKGSDVFSTYHNFFGYRFIGIIVVIIISFIIYLFQKKW